MIETPCWITGAETIEDLFRVHVWNGMAHLRNAANDDDPRTAAAIYGHLTAMCLNFRPPALTRKGEGE